MHDRMSFDRPSELLVPAPMPVWKASLLHVALIVGFVLACAGAAYGYPRFANAHTTVCMGATCVTWRGDAGLSTSHRPID